MRKLPAFIALIFIASLAGCVANENRVGPPGSMRGEITHIVCMRLKNAGDADARREVLTARKTLEHLPGVISVVAGSTIKSDRPVVDRVYDLVFVMRFHNRADLDAYLGNPAHVQTKKDVLDRYVEKYVVYDFAAE